MAWRQWLKTLMALVILNGLAELILPSGGVNKFAKLVLGLVIMLAVLQPFLFVFEPDFEISALNWQSDLKADTKQWPDLAARVQDAGSRPFLENVDPALARQIEVLLLTLDQVSEVRVSLEFSTNGLATVLVQLAAENDSVWAKARKITAGYLNIAEDKVVVAELVAN